MGDRTNLVISFKSTAAAATLEEALPGSIVIYSHWGGHGMGISLADALRHAQPRWADHSYAARILVSRIIGESWKRETGYGLLVGETSDNEHAILLVDLEEEKVRLFGEAGTYVSADRAKECLPTAAWSFQEFAQMTPEQATVAHLGGTALI